MANKHNPPGGDERSDVEFLYFKGKLRSADIQALVSGFTSTRGANTLPGRAPSKQIPAPGTQSGQNGASEPDREVDLDLVEEAEVQLNAASESTPSKPRSSRGTTRTYPTPAAVDMDMEQGGKRFKDFAQEKGPTSHDNKYLVAAAWYNEYAKLETITAGHVRSCYIDADWTYNVKDPLQPFRNLRDVGRGKLEDGNFTIGHLGLGKVKEMKAK